MTHAVTPTCIAPHSIEFYRANEKPHGCFSNLFRREITVDGLEFPTAEHAYQWAKPRKEAVRNWLMDSPTTSLLAMAAHGLYRWDVVSNWAEIKVERMRTVLLAKFTQHADLKDVLLSTGDCELVESATIDNPVNRYWGKVNGRGKNMLGRLLMEVREILDSPELRPLR